MIIDLLNFCRYYPGTEANILFRLLENGMTVPSFFCITEDTEEDELNNYLQNHFQHTELFDIKLSLSFEGHGSSDIPDSPKEAPCFNNVPKSAIIYSAEKLFAEAKYFVRNLSSDHKCISTNVIIQEAVRTDISGNLFTASKSGLLNETLIFIDKPLEKIYSEYDLHHSIYCCDDDDGIIFAYEPDGADKASLILVRDLLAAAEKIKNIFEKYALDIRFSADIRNKKLYIKNINEIFELLSSDREKTIYDSTGVTCYFPGVVNPLYASMAMSASDMITERMLVNSAYDGKSPEKFKGLLEYINGRLYFNINKMEMLKKELNLSEDTQDFISPSFFRMISQSRECGGIIKWHKKYKTIIKTSKMLDSNLKRSKIVFEELDEVLESLKNETVPESYDSIKECTEKIKNAVSECTNANQLNTVYMNFNRIRAARLKHTDKKVIKLNILIHQSEEYRKKLRKYYHSLRCEFFRLSRVMGRYLENRGIIEKSSDISMLEYDEVFSSEEALVSVNAKSVIEKRKKKFEWYRELPGFTRMVFSGNAESAPGGKIHFITSVSENSHIRGFGQNRLKAVFPAVILEGDTLPEKCDPEVIYVMRECRNISPDKTPGGLVIVNKPSMEDTDPDAVPMPYPVIFSAEHADSIIKNGDIVTMDALKGDIFIKHIKN